MAKSEYTKAGVDIDKAASFVEQIKPLLKSTFHSGVLSDIGGFGALFSLGTNQYNNPVLVTSTDGVGTKLRVAFMMNKHDTVGIDLVAMCVNDIVTHGAKPLFLLDYMSMGKLDTGIAFQVVKGITVGCNMAKCSLVGGETAEMPGFYQEREYDLAGFVVGVVESDKVIDGSEIGMGHQLIGISSTGLHSNGYSLARKIIFDELKLTVYDKVEGLNRTIGDELLEPTKIYSETVLNLLRDYKISGICHITGGGIIENLPRILPKTCQARIKVGSWEIPPIFSFLKEKGGISDFEMLRTFNNGIGMILVILEDQVQDVLARLNALNERAFLIGKIVSKKDQHPSVEFV